MSISDVTIFYFGQYWHIIINIIQSMNINSDMLNQMFPVDDSAASKAQRQKIWSSWDKNQNGFVELKDIEEQLCNMLSMDPSINTQSIVKRSAEEAKEKAGSIGQFGKNILEKKQLRYFMSFLNKHLVSLKIFQSLDKDGDNQIDEQQLVAATKLLTKWDVDEDKRVLAKQLTVERRFTFHKFEEWLNSFQYFNAKDVDSKQK